MTFKVILIYSLLVFIKCAVAGFGVEEESYYTIDRWEELSDGIVPSQRQRDLFKIVKRNSLLNIEKKNFKYFDLCTRNT